MSEKRFIYGVIKGSRQAHITDCHTCKSATIDVYDDNIKYFVDLLNTLHQENQQLKHYKLYEDNKRLQTIIADLKDDKNQLHKVISKLRQEVAELKTRNSVLSSKLNQIPKSIKEVWLDE